MYYDDVDISIVDRQDSFGVLESSYTATPSLDRFSKKTLVEKVQMKRESHVPFDLKNLQDKCGKKMRSNVDQMVLERPAEKKLESSKVTEVFATDFKFKPAITFQEKLSVLEERDRYLRETIYRENTKNMNIIAEGTCPDMCPEKERLLREINCSFSTFEGQIVQSEMHVVPELLVKEYARSSADQEEPLPHELRPEPVLIDTMSHLLANIIPKFEEPTTDVGEWYHFCWDRLRSLRKDIIQQQLCSTSIVQLLEQSARFHICCFDRLFDCDRRIFDDKINAENLVNCLQMLMNMYEDLEACGERCENEYEFRIYMTLLLLDSGDLPDIFRWYDKNASRQIEEVKDIYFSFKLKLYTKFFKLVKKTNYLNACLLQRYFATVRAHVLNSLVNAYALGSNKAAKFPLAFVKRILEMENDEDTISFVESYGFSVDYQSNDICVSKSSFTLPETKPVCKCSYILKGKRFPILQAVTHVKNYQVERKLLKVHSSFDEKDTLQKDAWNAEDQRIKVIQLYGDIYETMEATSNIAEKTDDNADSTRHVQGQVGTLPKLCGVLTAEQVRSKNISLPSTSSFNVSTFKYNKLNNAKSETDVIDANIGTVKSDSFTSFTFELRNHSDTQPVVTTVEQTPTLESIYKKFSTEFVTTSSNKPVSVIAVPKYEEHLSEITSDIIEVREEPTILARAADEVLNSLTSALYQFEQVYWDHFGVTEDDRIVYQQLQTLEANRKLRKVVKNRLKRTNALKVIRIWKQKVENRRMKSENYVGVTHLPPKEYFRLWGTVRGRDNSSLVKEIKESQNATKWSATLLNAKAYSIKYMGNKFANHLISTLRCRNARNHCVDEQLPSVVCWKLSLILPDNRNLIYKSFVTKLAEFCRALYYDDEKSELGSVQVIRTNGKRVLTIVNVKTGIIDAEFMNGVSQVIIFVNELWENLDQCTKRISNTCNVLSNPVYISLAIFGECSYKSDIADLMAALLQESLISGWCIVKWKQFFTIPKLVSEAYQHIPIFPSFRVRNLESFVETAGSDFFANLYYVWNNRSENTPIAYIDLYNKFLIKLKNVVEKEHVRKYNLSPEFLPHIVNGRNNFTTTEVSSLIGKYSLINFTRWPPSTLQKMLKLLNKYCKQIENDSSSTLLPNILRLINLQNASSVEDVNSQAPWMKIVELWFRYNLYSVSKKEEARNVYIFYEVKEIDDVSKGLWINTGVGK